MLRQNILGGGAKKMFGEFPLTHWPRACSNVQWGLMVRTIRLVREALLPALLNLCYGPGDEWGVRKLFRDAAI